MLVGIEVNFRPFQDGVNAYFGISFLLAFRAFLDKTNKINQGTGPAYY
jgi:hypothetical protein